ncbi:MAG: SDR family NAD(P)-dependent oxidoreductase, partial [Opitutaceae bacterium]
MTLKDQVVLVTGASSGIGRATAEAMARQGARVAVNYCRNGAGADEAVATITRLGGEALTFPADVTSAAAVGEMVKGVMKQWGRIDVLVNNAGSLLARRDLSGMTEEYWDQM